MKSKPKTIELDEIDKIVSDIGKEDIVEIIVNETGLYEIHLLIIIFSKSEFHSDTWSLCCTKSEINNKLTNLFPNFFCELGDIDSTNVRSSCYSFVNINKLLTLSTLSITSNQLMFKYNMVEGNERTILYLNINSLKVIKNQFKDLYGFILICNFDESILMY